MRAATVILIIILCACRTDTKLSDDKGIQDIFSPSELADLEKVLSDFDKLVLNVTNASDVETGYLKLSETLTFYTDKTDWIPIDEAIIAFARQTVIELKDKPVFDGLWYLNGIQSYQPRDSLVKATPKTWDSKYSEFLDHCIREDSYLEPYKESIQSAGDVGPTLFHTFPQAIRELKLEKDCIRLFIAIHFINARNEQSYNRDIHGAEIRFPEFKTVDKSKGIFDQLIGEPTEMKE